MGVAILLIPFWAKNIMPTPFSKNDAVRTVYHRIGRVVAGLRHAKMVAPLVVNGRSTEPHSSLTTSSSSSDCVSISSCAVGAM